MKNTRNVVAILALVVFLFGAGYLIWNGRPVVQMQNNTEVVSPNPSEPVIANEVPPETPTETPSIDGGYTLEEIAAHATKENCWSAIGGSVYDLTTWVSRHPGGEKSILGLCGIDGTERFEKKHGSSKTAQGALLLLKIGLLK
jgi:hypothetical protein